MDLAGKLLVERIWSAVEERLLRYKIHKLVFMNINCFNYQEDMYDISSCYLCKKMINFFKIKTAFLNIENALLDLCAALLFTSAVIYLSVGLQSMIAQKTIYRRSNIAS